MQVKKLIVAGSIAYDYIMGFSGDFNENVHNDPKENQFHLPVMPESKELRFGGTSGNIGYNLSLLQQKTHILTSVGKDFRELGYEARFAANPYLDFIGDFHSDLYCANCYMVNDKWLNQIIIFHGGALSESSQIHLADRGFTNETVKWISISPDNVMAMNQWAKESTELKIPFVFDPGQVTPAFTKEMLEAIIPHADILIGNQFEMDMIQKKMDLTLPQLIEMISALIITKGTEGSILYHEGQSVQIPCASPSVVKDPTGAGDGYRSGLLCGLMQDKSLEDACRMGSVVASFVVESIGPQTQTFTLTEFAERYQNTFHDSIHFK